MLRVLAGNCRHYHVARGKEGNLAGKIGRERGVVIFIALHLGIFWRDITQHHILHRASRDADGFAAQGFRIGKGCVFRAKDAEEERRIGAAKIDYPLALGVFTEA